MIKIRKSIVVIVACVLLLGHAPRVEAQRLATGAFGAVAGTLSGGYITLSVVVARAQTGHYLHQMQDIFSWNALPVLIGGSTGTALGIYDPDRLMTGFVYGSVGTLVGGTAGFLIGGQVSDRPEGKWAGGAIGAGLGMAIGSTWGVLAPNPRMNFFSKNSDKAVVPITIRIPTN